MMTLMSANVYPCPSFVAAAGSVSTANFDVPLLLQVLRCRHGNLHCKERHNHVELLGNRFFKPLWYVTAVRSTLHIMLVLLFCSLSLSQLPNPFAPSLPPSLSLPRLSSIPNKGNLVVAVIVISMLTFISSWVLRFAHGRSAADPSVVDRLWSIVPWCYAWYMCYAASSSTAAVSASTFHRLLIMASDSCLIHLFFVGST